MNNTLYKEEVLKKFSIIWMIIYQLCSTTLPKPWMIVTCCHFCVGFSKCIQDIGTLVSCPFEEYVPDFTKPLRCVQDKCAHMITEIISLLKHIRSCQYLPMINTVEKMDNLQKLNTDLIAILDEYFNTNIWIPDSEN